MVLSQFTRTFHRNAPNPLVLRASVTLDPLRFAMSGIPFSGCNVTLPALLLDYILVSICAFVAPGFFLEVLRSFTTLR
jgi:hypothetical protein